jgi:hypothetical protein
MGGRDDPMEISPLLTNKSPVFRTWAMSLAI